MRQRGSRKERERRRDGEKERMDGWMEREKKYEWHGERKKERKGRKRGRVSHQIERKGGAWRKRGVKSQDETVERGERERERERERKRREQRGTLFAPGTKAVKEARGKVERARNVSYNAAARERSTFFNGATGTTTTTKTKTKTTASTANNNNNEDDRFSSKTWTHSHDDATYESVVAEFVNEFIRQPTNPTMPSGALRDRARTNEAR